MLNAQSLLKWYDQNARQLPWRVSPSDRKSGIKPDPYRIWLSEIMLQQTTVVTVKDYYRRFLGTWPTIHDLATAPLDDVLTMWAGLGYYARARNLHACAQEVAQNHAGTFPRDSQSLSNLLGIGPYTSAAIAAICYDERVAVIDGNVERVTSRLLALPTPVKISKTQIRDAVQSHVPKRAGDFAQAMMDLGASICTPRNPKCDTCPLSQNCQGFASGKPEHFPIKLPKKPHPIRFGHAFVIQRESGEVLLQKRPDKGLLAKMTQVPNSEWTPGHIEVDFPVPGDWKSVDEVVHIFTHFRLELRVWHFASCTKSQNIDGFWVNPSQLQHQAIPTLFTKVLAAANLP